MSDVHSEEGDLPSEGEEMEEEYEEEEDYSDEDNEDWFTAEIHGEWDSEAAGGCLNFPSCVRNPQYHLRVDQAAEAQICITQEDEQLDTIGVYLLKFIPDEDMKTLSGRMPKIVPANLVSKSKFASPLEAVLEVDLEPGIDYVVMPCTFDPNHESVFQVVVAANQTQPHLELLEVEEDIDSQAGIALNFEEAMSPRSEASEASADGTMKGIVTDTAHAVSALSVTNSTAGGEGVEDVVTELSNGREIEGEWTENSAGGCINYFSWKQNPQYIVRVSGAAAKQPVIITLKQSRTEHSIGFYVLKREKTHGGLRKVTPMALDEIVGKASFHRTPSVQCTVPLDGGYEYIIIPCTFRPKLVASFKLSASSDKFTAKDVELSLCRGHWQNLRCDGGWDKDSAGGCRNHPTWRKNPQWIVTVPDGATRALVSLSQPFSDNLSGIGMYCSPAPDNDAMVVSLDKSEILIHAAFRRDQEVFCALPVGDGKTKGSKQQGQRKFTIIPCTFTPGCEAKFQVNVYCDMPGVGLLAARATAEKQVEGKWGKGSCGGCANHRTWRTNTSHYLRSGVKARVKVVLEQSPGIQRPDENKNVWSTIGFYITRPDDDGRPLLKLQQDQIIAKTPFTGSKEVAFDIDVDPAEGVYVITPCTFYPGVRAPYALKVFADPSKMEHIQISKPDPDWHRYTLEGDWAEEKLDSNSKKISKKSSKSSSSIANQPQFKLECSSEGTRLAVFVAQHQDKLEPVGVRVYEGDGVAGKEVFASDFIRAQEVSHSVTLGAGLFTLVTRLLQSSSSGQFTLDLYSDKAITATAQAEPSLLSPRRTVSGQIERPDTPIKDGEDARKHICKEILSTEVNYVDSLQMVHDHFLLPMQAHSRKGGAFTNVEFKTIFFNINVILNINKQLLKDLQLRWETWGPDQKLGDIFLQMVDYLKVYSTYVNNYNKAMGTFRQCRQDKDFVALLQDCINSTGKKSAGLQDYLIMPVQRVPRYVLLLQQLLKKTQKTHIDHSDLALALQKMLEVTVDIEEKKKDAENLERLMGLAEMISNKPADLNIVAPHRKYVREGPLRMQREGKKSSVHAFLTNDMLIITRTHSGGVLKGFVKDSTQGQQRSYRFVMWVALKKEKPPTLENVKGAPGFSMEARDGKRVILMATGDDERQAWMVDINSTFYEGNDDTEGENGGGSRYVGVGKTKKR
eukprot:TRINITY_DN3293_c0_g1_i1.p1 TRINITY_DN3293_c0_g1~~TRINITY_DN3293_c0_g1_i1.p1  ORF type:complete len:1188 (+),score=330.11 TRINITY_DN3293_c0_g1_i1:280-3843(+)